MAEERAGPSAGARPGTGAVTRAGASPSAGSGSGRAAVDTGRRVSFGSIREATARSSQEEPSRQMAARQPVRPPHSGTPCGQRGQQWVLQGNHMGNSALSQPQADPIRTAGLLTTPSPPIHGH